MLRTPQEIKERVRLALIESINGQNLGQLMIEPENLFPSFIEQITNNITDIVLDEIEVRRRY